MGKICQTVWSAARSEIAQELLNLAVKKQSNSRQGMLQILSISVNHFTCFSIRSEAMEDGEFLKCCKSARPAQTGRRLFSLTASVTTKLINNHTSTNGWCICDFIELWCNIMQNTGDLSWAGWVWSFYECRSNRSRSKSPHSRHTKRRENKARFSKVSSATQVTSRALRPMRASPRSRDYPLKNNTFTCKRSQFSDIFIWTVLFSGQDVQNAHSVPCVSKIWCNCLRTTGWLPLSAISTATNHGK